MYRKPKKRLTPQWTRTERASNAGTRGESNPRRPGHAQDKSQAPGNQGAEGQKQGFTPGDHRRGFRALVELAALSNMGSMATAIRKSTMRRWGPFSRGASLCPPVQTVFVPAGHVQNAQIWVGTAWVGV